jgi:4-hydroxybenzoate polyprenyltransferase
MAATLRTYLELVRFSHTIFALPFVIMAVLIAIASGDSPATAMERRRPHGSSRSWEFSSAW